MKSFIVSLLFIMVILPSMAQEVPFLAGEYFDFKLDYDFKTRPVVSGEDVNLIEERRYSATSPLPYVKVSFTFKNFPDEAFRLRIEDNKGGSNKSKKVSKVDVLEFDLGFSDDIKDRVKPHIFYIYLENKEKERLSRIKIFIEESGEFYLNDKLFGKI